MSVDVVFRDVVLQLSKKHPVCPQLSSARDTQVSTRADCLLPVKELRNSVRRWEGEKRELGLESQTLLSKRHTLTFDAVMCVIAAHTNEGIQIIQVGSERKKTSLQLLPYSLTKWHLCFPIRG